jgi:hypothetical protein
VGSWDGILGKGRKLLINLNRTDGVAEGRYMGKAVRTFLKKKGNPVGKCIRASDHGFAGMDGKRRCTLLVL